jgi:hypothetical protein
VVSGFASAEEAAATVDATELELVLVQRVSNGSVDTVGRSSLTRIVIIMKKAERAGQKKLI